MIERVHLKYRKIKGAEYRYEDSAFDEARLWVSRLLAQFIEDNALVISIDETGFRTDTGNRMGWVFEPDLHRLKQIKLPQVKARELERAVEMKLLYGKNIGAKLDCLNTSTKTQKEAELESNVE